MAGVPIHRIHIRGAFGQGLANVMPLLRWWVAALAWLLHDDWDAVHACDFDAAVPAWLAKVIRRRGIVVYDIFDYYAEMLRKTPKVLLRLLKWLDTLLIGAADAVVLADELRLEQIRPAKPTKLIYIYNSPRDSAEKSSESDEPYILYIGLLQRERGLFELISAAENLPSCRLKLGGYGGDADEIRTRVAGSDSIEYVGVVPYETTLALTRRSAILVALYDDAVPNHRYASPNKLFEAMMCGKPLIVAAGSVLAEHVRRIGNGVVVQYGNVEQLKAALRQLLADPNLRLRMGAAGRAAFAHYSWEEMERRLLSLYAELQTGV